MPVLAGPRKPNFEGLHLFHSGNSSCAQRVRIALDEKQLPWTSHVVDLKNNAHLRPGYLAINPRGYIPALVHDGRVVVESLDILSYLDEAFPETSLAPSPALGDLTRDLTTVVDHIQRPLKTLSYEFVFRPGRQLTAADAKAYGASHPDPKAGGFVRAYVENGNAWRQMVQSSMAQMTEGLNLANDVLQVHSFLSGSQFGRTDVAWLPTIHRLNLMAWPLARHAHVADWFARLQARASYRSAILEQEPQAFRTAADSAAEARARDGSSLTQLCA